MSVIRYSSVALRHSAIQPTLVQAKIDAFDLLGHQHGLHR